MEQTSYNIKAELPGLVDHSRKILGLFKHQTRYSFSVRYFNNVPSMTQQTAVNLLKLQLKWGNLPQQVPVKYFTFTYRVLSLIHRHCAGSADCCGAGEPGNDETLRRNHQPTHKVCFFENVSS